MRKQVFTRKRLIGLFLLALILGGVYVVGGGILEIIGTRSTGTAEEIDKVPDVGYLFAALRTEGPVQYASWRAHRGSTYWISGKATLRNLKAFCDVEGHEFWESFMGPRDLSDSLEPFGADTSEFTRKFSAEDPAVLGYPSSEVYFHINYRYEDGRFLIMVCGPWRFPSAPADKEMKGN